jgi:hypothetical protein
VVEHSNSSLFKVIDSFKRHAAMVEAEILKVRHGEQSRKPARKGTEKFKDRQK